MSEQPEELKSKRIDESVFEADARRELEKSEEPLDGELIIAAKNFSRYGPLQPQDWFLYLWLRKQMDKTSRGGNEGTNSEIRDKAIRFNFYVERVSVLKHSPEMARDELFHEYPMKDSTLADYDKPVRHGAMTAANMIFEKHHIPKRYILRSTRIVCINTIS